MKMTSTEAKNKGLGEDDHELIDHHRISNYRSTAAMELTPCHHAGSTGRATRERAHATGAVENIVDRLGTVAVSASRVTRVHLHLQWLSIKPSALAGRVDSQARQERTLKVWGSH